MDEFHFKIQPDLNDGPEILPENIAFDPQSFAPPEAPRRGPEFAPPAAAAQAPQQQTAHLPGPDSSRELMIKLKSLSVDLEREVVARERDMMVLRQTVEHQSKKAARVSTVAILFAIFALLFSARSLFGDLLERFLETLAG